MKMKGSESNFLAQSDVPHPMNVAMSHVKMEPMKDENDKYVLHFLGNGIKPMILNAGNRKTLISAYGDDTDQYRGKQVEVYVNPDVEFGGERVGGLRLRVPANSLPPQNGQAPQQPGSGRPMPGNGWSINFAIEEAAKHGITREAIIAAVKAHGHTGWNPARDTPTVQCLIRDADEMAQGEQSFDEPLPAATDGSIPF